MPGPSRAYCSIKTQFENAGDALIVRELILLLAARVPVIVDLSRCPPDFRKTLHIDSNAQVSVLTRGFPYLFWRMLVDRARGHRISYFLVPGGLGGEKSVWAAAKAWVFNGLLLVMRLVGIRPMQLGISYENVGPRHRAMLQARSRLLHRHFVRDQGSFDYASSLGIKVSGVLPDLAFNLFRSDLPAVRSRAAIAFSFRTDKSTAQAGQVAELILRIARIVPQGTVLKFVSQVTRDDAFMREMAERVRDQRLGQTEFVSCADDIDACAEVYADSIAVYSNRLHALMIAASVGARPVAMVDAAVDGKIAGVFSGAGWDGLVWPLGGPFPDDALAATLGPSEALSGEAQVVALDAFFDGVLAPAPAVTENQP